VNRAPYVVVVPASVRVLVGRARADHVGNDARVVPLHPNVGRGAHVVVAPRVRVVWFVYLEQI
jgi:hypothetical protein